MISNPAIVLGANQVEVFGLGVILSLPDLVGVLRPQPRLEEIRVSFLPMFNKQGQVFLDELISLKSLFGRALRLARWPCLGFFPVPAG